MLYIFSFSIFFIDAYCLHTFFMFGNSISNFVCTISRTKLGVRILNWLPYIENARLKNRLKNAPTTYTMKSELY